MTLPVGPNHSTIVDLDTFKRLGLKWYVLKPQIHKRAGKVYVVTRCGGKELYLHRMIIGALPGQIVDHINGNGLDNRAANLRSCTVGQNRANTGKTRINRSGLKGVSWCRTSRKWAAIISKAGIRYYLGLFVSKKRAGLAHDRAAKALHGEFAGLNYPQAATRPKMPIRGYVLGSRRAAAI